MRKFNVGDRARVNLPGNEFHGTICTVTGHLEYGRYRVGPGNFIMTWAHSVDLPPPDGCSYRAYEPKFLEPAYDGNEKVSWSDCIWKPVSVLEGSRE